VFIYRTTMDPLAVSSYLHGKPRPTVEKVLYAFCMILRPSPLDSQPCCIKPFILSAFKVLLPSKMVSPSAAKHNTARSKECQREALSGRICSDCCVQSLPSSWTEKYGPVDPPYPELWPVAHIGSCHFPGWATEFNSCSKERSGM
jgi:hypothetical protein